MGFFVLTQKGEAWQTTSRPKKLSKEMGIKRDEVIRLCHEQAVPIYHGKIDKFLFSTVVQETAVSG